MHDARYTGHLKRGTEPNTVVGQICDSFGWIISLTGERQADGTYALTGTLGPVPEALRIPILDDDPSTGAA